MNMFSFLALLEYSKLIVFWDSHGALLGLNKTLILKACFHFPKCCEYLGCDHCLVRAIKSFVDLPNWYFARNYCLLLIISFVDYFSHGFSCLLNVGTKTPFHLFLPVYSGVQRTSLILNRC